MADEALLGLSDGDLLTVRTAARALHIREADARAWLHDEGLVRVRTIGGRAQERVIWGDVLAAWRRGDEPREVASPPQERATLRRSSMVR